MASLSFVSINVKCPDCNKALMDHEQKVDNEPSIKLGVSVGGKNGNIWLSSTYGSYNYVCNVDLPDDEVVSFYCPNCMSELNTEDLCDACQAPLVSLILDMGGKVSFCTRKGCKNHNIGFEDLSEAMKKLYQENEYKTKGFSEAPPTPAHLKKEVKKVQSVAEENKEIIETGTFLMSYCPHCKKSLLNEDMLKLKIINEKGEEGYVMLSPYLNVFSSKSTVYLPEDKLVKDIKCFHCDKSLIVDDTKCQWCGSVVARIMVSARTKMLDFYICSKKGCKWHGVNRSDMEDIRLEDSLEW